MHSNILWHDKGICGTNLCNLHLTHIIHIISLTQKFVTLQYVIIHVYTRYNCVLIRLCMLGSSVGFEVKILNSAPPQVSHLCPFCPLSSIYYTRIVRFRLVV